jgi:hypothetical protein
MAWPYGDHCRGRLSCSHRLRTEELTHLISLCATCTDQYWKNQHAELTNCFLNEVQVTVNKYIKAGTHVTACDFLTALSKAMFAITGCQEHDP